MKFHLDDHINIFKAIMKILSRGPSLQVETNASGSLAVEIRKNPEYTLLHLINVTGDMKRPIGQIVPLKDVHFAVKFQKKPQSVRAALSGYHPEFEHVNGYLKFKLPEIEAYELIVIEKSY